MTIGNLTLPVVSTVGQPIGSFTFVSDEAMQQLAKQLASQIKIEVAGSFRLEPDGVKMFDLAFVVCPVVARDEPNGG